MDEMRMLADVLGGPDQSDDTIDQARHRLRQAMHGGPARGRRAGWLAGGLGLTAAAATAAVVVVSSSTTGPADKPHAPPASPSQSSVRLSGRQVLLTAATTALTAPQTSGRYWYVKTAYSKGGAEDTIETWVALNGRSWVRVGSARGPAVNNDGANGHWSDGFDVGASRLSYQQIQHLPSDPAALRSWIAAHAGTPGERTVHETDTIGALSGLLSGVPAPPKVRATAFRLLAALPGVRSLGPMEGGQGVSLPDPVGQNILVVDLTTAKVHGAGTDVINGKKVTGGDRVVTAEWTNTLPR